MTNNIASPWLRFLAYLTDFSLSVFIFMLFLFYIASQQTLPQAVFAFFVYLIVILFNPIVYLQTILFTYYCAGTIGKLLTGLRVVNESYTKLSFKRIFFRQKIGYAVSGMAFWLGFLAIIKDKNRQGWHDKIIGSLVIVKYSHWPVAAVACLILLGSSVFLGQQSFKKITAGPLHIEAQRIIKKIASTVQNEKPKEVSLWKETTPLPSSLIKTSLAIAQDHIYIIGGADPVTDEASDTIYVASISANGTLTKWQKTTPLPYPLSFSAAAASNGFLYILGGERKLPNGQYTIYGRSFFAKINRDGSLGQWIEAQTLPVNVSGPQLTAANSNLYTFNGWYNVFSDQAYYAHITDQGTITPWQKTASLSALDSSSNPKVKLYQNKLYAIGLGKNQNQTLIYSTSINPNGSLETWQEASALPNGVLINAREAFDYNKIYVHTFTDTKEDMYIANIVSDGTIGPWHAVQTGEEQRNSPMYVYNNNLYLIGGTSVSISGKTSYLTSIEYTHLNSKGQIEKPK